MQEAPGLAAIADILAATADAHSSRALARSLGEALARHLPIVRVVLGPPAPTATAVLSAEGWRAIDPGARATSAAARGHLVSLAPGLAVVLRAPLPELATRPAFRDALAQVLHAAARHLDVVERVAELSRRAYTENRALRASLEPPSPALVARSPAMQAVLARAALVAHHATTVLVTGESGTGKELLAAELHRRSPRAHRPMVVLNCAAIPSALVESELFGHERGAFTGADRAHAGVFERADRGTLLLDEIGELPPGAQAKLLRVLQERTIRRVGGSRELAVDVRLIAATHRSLRALAEAGGFREDLLYRLDVFAIAIPPLRERREDLAPLVAALTARLAAKLGVPAPPISRATLARLAAHTWPGNVRELMNVLETALILGEGRTLALPPLPEPTAARSSFAAAMRATIEAALRATHGKVYGADGAAARLGMPPATLQSKLKKLGISRGAFVARGDAR